MTRTAAGIAYELTFKKVKNINLRVGRDGAVKVSAAKRVPLGELDRFVASRAAWIAAARERVKSRVLPPPPVSGQSDADCLAAFAPVFERVYLDFADIVPEKPALRVRLMKSLWGVCHLKGHYITLNKLLLDKPAAALEYVILHEFVHFLHPNHQAGFHAEMARRMPDYKARRALLR